MSAGGFQASGLYLFGDNGWATPTSGVDVLQTGTTQQPGARRRLDDSRATASTCRRCTGSTCACSSASFRPPVAVDGIVEVFNVFNHANYGAFMTNESSSRYGQPTET